MASPKVLDKHWLRQSFLLPVGNMDDEDILRRKTSKGYHKFSDTTLGGNIAINPLPQFSKFTDIREKRLHNGISGDESDMGRWYSENIDDNGVYINVRCGNPMFNATTTFFSSFYNSQASSLARTGRTNEFFYGVGSAAGFVVSWFAAPLVFVGTMWDILMSKPKTKYYYLKPAMTSYWSAVQNIVNTIMVNKGMLANQHAGEETEDMTNAQIEARNAMLPDIFTLNGQFDIYNVATRYQRRANRLYAELAKLKEVASNPQDLDNQERSYFESGGFLEVGDRDAKLSAYVEEYMSRPTTSPDTQQTVPVETSSESSGGGGDPAVEVAEQVEAGLFSSMAESLTSYFSPQMKESLIAELNDGGQFVTFKVDNPGTVSESFQTSVKESQVASSINATSQGARDFRFNFADGSFIGGGVGAAIGAVTNAATSLISGFADKLAISGIASLFGNALVDIPKYWDSSTANLPRMNYTMQFRSTYGLDICEVQDLWVPVSMLLAMSLPLSTGPQSYTQPFLCEVYCKGRAQSKLCMVDSLEITRGTGSKGWKPDGGPTGVDVSISFVDLSSVMHVPITAGFNPISTIFSPGGITQMLAGDEGAFADYLATISGLGLAEQIYPFRKLARNYHLGQANMASWLSPSHAASWLGGTGLGRVTSGLFAAAQKT